MYCVYRVCTFVSPGGAVYSPALTDFTFMVKVRTVWSSHFPTDSCLSIDVLLFPHDAVHTGQA